MTGDVVIRAEGLGKKYVIGHEVERERYTALRDVIARNMKRLARSSADLVRGRAMVAGDEIEEFWALKDINFEIKRGEIFGVIGRNGAGKSTLLKILSRITEPSQGRVEIKGCFASLLEVGTGFHLELTGRENIFLNGAILGMRRAEIRRKLDQIVDFSGIEQFLDTPTKRYSSGMLVRLGFAVAAHLEAEILIIDEVLAVGDAEFQKKCLGKINDVSKGGRTILFVSHNMGIVGSLCPHVIWVDHGKIREQGAASKIIGQYMSAGPQSVKNGTVQFSEDLTKPFQLTLAQTVDRSGTICEAFSCDDPVLLICNYVVRETVPGLYGYLSITRSDGVEVLVSDSFDAQKNPLEHLEAGSGRFRISIPARTLAPGDYLTLLNFTSHRSKVGFNVYSPGIVARFRLDDYTTRRGNMRGGYLSTKLEWTFEPKPICSETL